MPALYATLSASGIYESPKYVDSGAEVNHNMPDIVPSLHSSILYKHLEISAGYLSLPKLGVELNKCVLDKSGGMWEVEEGRVDKKSVYIDIFTYAQSEPIGKAPSLSRSTLLHQSVVIFVLTFKDATLRAHMTEVSSQLVIPRGLSHSV
ncbi:hypothetical protein ACTXT7_011700 [Hymenolepis weldensis]